jgi:hypothetical protein
MGLGGAARDLASMLRDCGTPVRLGMDQETPGIIDTSDEDLIHGAAATFAGAVTAIVISTGALRGLAVGSIVWFEDVFYRVIQTRRQNDGRETRILCRPEG